MVNRGGFGRGYGFRGNSPSWPFVGRGRGGFPRCWAYGPNNYYEPGYYPETFQVSGASPFGSPVTPDQEVVFLKNQAEKLKEQVEYIVARVEEFEKAAKQS